MGVAALTCRAAVLSGLTLFVLLIVPKDYSSGGYKQHQQFTSVDVEKQSSLNPDEFHKRHQTLSSFCMQINTTEIPNPRTLLYSKKLNIIYCPVLEAASLEIKYSMLKAEGKQLYHQKIYGLPKPQAIHTQAQNLNLHARTLNSPSKLNPNLHTLLIIVQHPWLRLSAAYTDLVVGKNFYTKQCRLFNNDGEKLMSFDGFLKCILFYANKTTDVSRLDSRLSPMTLTCSVCRTPYTTIGKSERCHRISEDCWPELMVNFSR